MTFEEAANWLAIDSMHEEKTIPLLAYKAILEGIDADGRNYFLLTDAKTETAARIYM